MALHIPRLVLASLQFGKLACIRACASRSVNIRPLADLPAGYHMRRFVERLRWRRSFQLAMWDFDRVLDLAGCE